MQKIVTNSVTPVHIVPYSGVGVMLVKEVIFAIPLDDAVRIVHPVRRRREVITRTVRIFSHLPAQALGFSSGGVHNGYPLSPLATTLWTNHF